MALSMCIFKTSGRRVDEIRTLGTSQTNDLQVSIPYKNVKIRIAKPVQQTIFVKSTLRPNLGLARALQMTYNTVPVSNHTRH